MLLRKPLNCCLIIVTLWLSFLKASVALSISHLISLSFMSCGFLPYIFQSCNILSFLVHLFLLIYQSSLLQEEILTIVLPPYARVIDAHVRLGMGCRCELADD